MFVEREIVKTRNILLAIFSVQFRVINMAIMLYLYKYRNTLVLACICDKGNKTEIAVNSLIY